MDDPRDRLEIGFALDRRWYWLMGEVERSREPALRAVVAALEQAGTPYAIMGGIAVQLDVAEPRTTIDIDIAVPSRTAFPVALLEAAGFEHRGSFEHSENWWAPDGTAVRFSDDPLLAASIPGSKEHQAAGLRFRVMRAEELVRAKLRAAAIGRVGAGSDAKTWWTLKRSWRSRPRCSTTLLPRSAPCWSRGSDGGQQTVWR